jgi:nucleotide-binding universal stress UspA family protein
MVNARVLVPLDGSAFAECALVAAMGMAQNLDAEMELISVVDDASMLAGGDVTAQKFKDWLQDYLDDLGQRVTDQSGVTTSCTIIDGTPADRLVEYARRKPVDLIAMSTHGRGPLSRAWMGSVADRVVRHVDVPVMLIRAEDEAAPDFKRPYEFKRILVALDGSPRAEKSLEWATRIASASGGVLTLLQAVEPPLPFSSPYLPHAVEDAQIALDHGREASARYLEETKARLERQGLRIEMETLLGAHAAPGILQYAEEHPVDLIALATHGRGGLPRLVLGSVADKVLRGASVPILVVRPATSHGREDRENEAAASGRASSLP